MSFIKQVWWCKVNEAPDISSLQEEQEMGFLRKVWERIKLLFVWVN